MVVVALLFRLVDGLFQDSFGYPGCGARLPHNVPSISDPHFDGEGPERPSEVRFSVDVESHLAGLFTGLFKVFGG